MEKKVLLGTCKFCSIAEGIELGGCYPGDYVYLAIKGDVMLIVSCGCWD